MREEPHKTDELLQTFRMLQKHPGGVMPFEDLTKGEIYTFYVICSLLYDGVEDTVRVSALTRKMELSPQAVSKNLRILEQKGYIERRTDPGDRRNTLILMQEKGARMMGEARERYYEFAGRVREKMGERDVAEFIRLSQKIMDVMKEISEEQTKRKEDGVYGAGNEYTD